MRWKAKQFYRHIIGHVQREDLTNVSQADQSAGVAVRGTISSSRRNTSAQPAKLINRRCADGTPEHAHGRERAERLEQPGQRGIRHLHRDDLGPGRSSTFVRRARIEQRPEPGMQRGEFLRLRSRTDQMTVATAAITRRQKASTQPNMQSPLPLLPPKDNGALT